jgi:hypothetical protein
MGIPEYEAKRYEGRIKDGGVLLPVHCDTSDEISRAKDVLKGIGAQDISSAGEQSSDVSEKRDAVGTRRTSLARPLETSSLSAGRSPVSPACSIRLSHFVERRSERTQEKTP